MRTHRLDEAVVTGVVALGLLVGLGPARAGTSKATSPPRAAPSGGRAAHPAPDVPAPIYGITLDNVEQLPEEVTALQRFSRKMTVRIVFDRGMGPSDYRAAVEQLHRVAYLLGQPVDSSYAEHYTPETYAARFREYLAAFGDTIDLWEVGNEVNGKWLGPPATVEAQVTAAYDIVKAAGKKTVLTLMYNEGKGCAASPPSCAQAAQYEMYAWVKAHVPARLRSGLDYVLLSYYPDSDSGFTPDWAREFERLGRIFPKAKLGFGEIGREGSEAAKAELIDQYYRMRAPHPRYIGGYFWWYGRQDLVPYTKPVWGALERATRPQHR